jgi:hypothetical protein
MRTKHRTVAEKSKLGGSWNMPVENVRASMRSTAHIKSATIEAVSAKQEKYINTLTPEMAEREKKAQEQLQEKFKRVAPMHKSNYIYLGDNPDETLVKSLGKKNMI